MITTHIGSPAITLRTPYAPFDASDVAQALSAPPADTNEPVDRTEAMGEATALAAQASDDATETSSMKRLVVGGMLALGVLGALSAHPVSAATVYHAPTIMISTTEKAKPAEVPTCTPPAPTAPVKPAAPEVDPKAVISATRLYITDMIDMNITQGETLATYRNVYINNINTLQRIQWTIKQNPVSLQDPAVRRAYEKIRATLDTVGEFSYETSDVVYQAGHETITTPDGSTISRALPPVTEINQKSIADYSGPGRLTDKTIRDIEELMVGHKVNHQ